MRVIIIDDEQKAIENLRIILNRFHPEVEIIAEILDSKNAVKIVRELNPDLIFTDINMPNMNGIALASEFKDYLPLKVFLTAHHEYAMDAIKNSVIGYLFKPIEIDELAKTISKAEKYLVKFKSNVNENNRYEYDKIALNVRDGIVFVNLKDIIYLSANGSYTDVVCDNNLKYLISKNLKEIEKRLPESHFFRCHKSFIINLQKITMLKTNQGYQAIMTNGEIAEVSKTAKGKLLDYLN
jgi:two-component system, LytTR family, response regulator